MAKRKNKENNFTMTTTNDMQNMKNTNKVKNKSKQQNIKMGMEFTEELSPDDFE